MSSSYRTDSFLMACAFPRCLYGWPVNRLETTSALPLVSNLSQSYNRHCGWESDPCNLMITLKTYSVS
jgi:hypothetical protein